MKIIGFEFFGEFWKRKLKIVWQVWEDWETINIRMIGIKIIGFEFFGEFWKRKLKVVWEG